MNKMNSETMSCIIVFVGEESFKEGEVAGKEAFMSLEMLDRGSCVEGVAVDADILAV